MTEETWALKEETAEKPVEVEETRTPDEWDRLPEVDPIEAIIASVVHQWRGHEYHAGKPIQLTKTDYLLAIEAGKKGQIHQAATGPYYGLPRN